MNRKIFLISFFLVLTIASLSYAQELPDTPADYFGVVRIDGTIASNGTIVAVYYDGILTDNVTTGQGFSCSISDCTGYYLAHASGTNASNITFKVYGVSVNEAAQTWSLGSHQLNLTMTKLSTGQACNYGISCASDSCVQSFSNTTRYCAGSGSCTNGGTSYANGLSVCSDSSTLQSCSSGMWIASACSNGCSSGSCQSSSSSGGGGGGSSSGPLVLTSTFDQITTSSPGTYTLSDTNSNVMKVTQVSIETKENIASVSLTLTQLSGSGSASTPTTSTTTGSLLIYQYVQIESTAPSTLIAVAKIKFKVDRNWITENNIDASTIVLERYNNNVWTKLKTTKLSEDSTHLYFEAESPGFSTFAITAQKFPPVESQPTTNDTTPPEPSQPPSPAPGIDGPVKLPPVELPPLNYIIIAGVLVILVAVLGWFYYHSRKVSKYSR